MSKQIDLGKKLSKEDREYLISRRRLDDVRVNDLEFGSLSDKQVKEREDQLDEDRKNDQEVIDEFEAQEAAAEQAAAENPYDEDLIDDVATSTTAQLRALAKKMGLDSKGDREAVQIRILESKQDERERSQED